MPESEPTTISNTAIDGDGTLVAPEDPTGETEEEISTDDVGAADDASLPRSRPRLGLAGKRPYAPGEPKVEDETASSGDLKSNRDTEVSEEEASIGAPASEALGGPLVEQLLPPIECAWNKTVQGIFEVGNLLKRAKDQLGKSYKQLVERLPFNATTAGNLVRVAEHRVLSDPAYWDQLPKALETLYYLSRLDGARVIEAIDRGEITPGLTLAKAKDLVGVGETKDSGPQGTAEQYVDVVVSIPKSADLYKAVQDVLNLAQTYAGTLDYHKNEKSVGGFWLKTIRQKALDGIANTKGQLPNTITYDEMCELDEGAAQELLDIKKRHAKLVKDSNGKPVEPRLPGDYSTYCALKTRTGLSEITLRGLKNWCTKSGIPTRLALLDVDQPVYVWEQLRLIADKKDEKAGRRRLEKIAKGKKPLHCEARIGRAWICWTTWWVSRIRTRQDRPKSPP